MAAEKIEAPGGRTLLEDLSLDLTHIATMLAHLAERDACRREVPVMAWQVRLLISARHARSVVFGMDLSNPGWSLLLELYLAHLEQRPVKPARLATDARLAMSTAQRWLDRLCAAGFAENCPEPARRRGAATALTPAGVAAMQDYFLAAAAAGKMG
jgi:DNA-binding MarR family transcriptional regulator